MSEMPHLSETRRPRFDWTINLGHLLSIFSMMLVVAGGYFSLTMRLGIVEDRVATMAALMERSIRNDEQIATLRESDRKQDVRIERLEQHPR